ncbi:RHS repeat domain-containing protein, partial [Butyricicoccus sp. AM78-15b2TA]
LGNQTTYAYDDKGRQLSVTDAEGGVTSFEYDAVGRIVAEHTKVSDSATATTRHTYSKAGKLLKTVDAL